MSAMGLEKPKEPVLENGTMRRKTAEGPGEAQRPYSKRNKRVKEMIEKRGGAMWEHIQGLAHTAHQEKAGEEGMVEEGIRQEMHRNVSPLP